MKKMDRKDFLKITGGAVAGGFAGYLFSGAPFTMFRKLSDWSQNQHAPAPGELRLISGICRACPVRCQVALKKAGDRVIGLESSSSFCPLGHDSLQHLYHPERITVPMKLAGEKGSGSYIPVSWNEALTGISAKMNALVRAKKGEGIAAVSGAMNASSGLLARLLESAGSGHAYHEPSLNELTIKTLGGVIDYDFQKTDLILSFGSRIFEGWGNPVAMNRFIAERKPGQKIIQIETNCSRTASMADEWIPVRPGTEAALAMGMAAYMIRERRRVSSGAGFSQWAGIVSRYDIKKTSQITGIPESRIISLAEDFLKASNPAALAGRGARAVSSSSAEIVAVFALNSLAGSRAATLSLPESWYPGNPYLKRAQGLDGFIAGNSFDMLFLNEANPVYRSVLGKHLAEKMKSAFVVAISPLMNESTVLADYILPVLSPVETIEFPGGAPVRNVPEARHAAEMILALASVVEGAAKYLPYRNYAEAVSRQERSRPLYSFSFRADILKKPGESFLSEKERQNYPLDLLPMELPVLGDNTRLDQPHVMKTVDPSIFSRGVMKVHMNRSTAEKLGLSDGDSIDIASERGRLHGLELHVTDTVAPDCLAVPLGFGHRNCTAWSNGRGLNPKPIMKADIDPLTGAADWWCTSVALR